MIVACFGDSLTAGLHDCPPGRRLDRCSFSPYAPLLEAELSETHVKGVTVVHQGYSGWTSQELLTSPRGGTSQPGLADMLYRKNGHVVDLVVILAGSNDIGKRRDASEEDIVESIWALHSVAHAKGIATLAISVPPTGYGMGVRSKDQWEATRARVNNLLRTRCAAIKPRCSYVDNPLTWSGAGDARWEPDAVHLSKAGYHALGVGVAPAVAAALGARRERSEL